ncbi:uncharacterized protein [Diadema antillarum]|uniref:uncharacterized protein n=1 Tax=Diadema antillarum TaxID=105358 RepID=UPI003A862CEE
MALFQLFAAAFIVCLFERSSALSCMCWYPEFSEEKFCPNQGRPDCPVGSQVTYDVCGCCKECTPMIGEPCAGAWNSAGRCSEGLVCMDRLTRTPMKLENYMYPNYPYGYCDKPESNQVDHSGDWFSVFEDNSSLVMTTEQARVESKEERKARKMQEREERRERKRLERLERKYNKKNRKGKIQDELSLF